MRFTSDSQRKAAFFNMSHRFSSRPEIHADPALFKNVKKEDLQFLDYPEEVYKMRIKRKPGVVRLPISDGKCAERSLVSINDSNFAAKPIPENEVYNLYESGTPIPEVAKAFGISVSSVKSILAGYAVNPAVIGYNPSDYLVYLKEVEGLDIDGAEGGRLVNYINGKDFDSLDMLMSGLRNKKKGFVRDDDERSEDYVSKGDFSHKPETIDGYECNGSRREPACSLTETKFSKKNKGFSETIDGYECDYCGCEFSSKVGARIHASTCDEKELQDDLDVDDGKDNFFSGDDGTF
jgi:hypothetical protein